jgi:diadenylate cyclase
MSITWRQYVPTDTADWVQLAVLVVVMYALLRLVRGTIAASILRGTFILVSLGVFIAAFVLRLFQLRVLQSILSTLLSTMVFALVIVFQPELRRALLSLGQHGLLGRFRRRKQRGALDVVVKAVLALSRERRGALFALERANALPHVAATGTRLDAEPTVELLTGIFYPGAPLHDGGVILRGDRVVAAGCIFPLADRRDLDSRLGTRHRAGVGLSEESDAVVVIVSEETGGVSVAVGGELTLVDPATELFPMILKLLSTEGVPPPPAPAEHETAVAEEATP